MLLNEKVKLNIKGKNINRFIKRLNNNNIELIKINIISKDESNITVYIKDLEKIKEISYTYNTSIVTYYGINKLKKKILFNKYILIFIIFFFCILLFFANLIFDIEVSNNDYKMNEKIINELNRLGIKKYGFKKSYKELKEIKSNILNKYKNEIEWLEIEKSGTKYIIKYEKRIINDKELKEQLRNIVATKDALIYKLDIKSGQIIKYKNEYVKKGDIIVSGYIKLNDEVKNTISSSGTVYGEVWYEVKVSYPFKYYEEKETGNKKRVLELQFLNNYIKLFDFNKYKYSKSSKEILLKNPLLPFKLSYKEEKELKIINENNTEEDIIRKSVMIGEEKIKKNLSKDEFILDYKILNKTVNKDFITLRIFYSVVENIGEYREIDKYEIS